MGHFYLVLKIVVTMSSRNDPRTCNKLLKQYFIKVTINLQRWTYHAYHIKIALNINNQEILMHWKILLPINLLLLFYFVSGI